MSTAVTISKHLRLLFCQPGHQEPTMVLGQYLFSECTAMLKISGNNCLSLRRNWGQIRQFPQFPFGSY